MADVITNIKHADGTLVTAQEAYDAFMTTRVLINIDSGSISTAANIEWYDNNSAQSDPTNVGYVIMRCLLNDGTTKPVSAGNSSLKPTGATA